MKKFLIVLAIYTAGEVSMAVRLNMIANSVAAHNGQRPIVKKPNSLLDYTVLRMIDKTDENSSKPVPIRFI